MVDLRWTLDEVCLSCDKHDGESKNRTFSRLRWPILSAGKPFLWCHGGSGGLQQGERLRRQA